MKYEKKQDNRSIIAQFSMLFIKRWRASLLLLITILFLGFGSYTTLLKREGFPEIEFPATLISTSYFVGDAEQVNANITQKIEIALKEIEDVTEVQSTTTDNFSSVIVYFPEGYNVEEGLTLVKDAVESDVSFPQAAEVSFLTFDVGTLDGENDLIFSLVADDKSVNEMQQKADEISEDLRKLNTVADVKTIELVATRINPATGEEFESVESFNRVGHKDANGNLTFKNAIDIGVQRDQNTGTIDLSDDIHTELDQLKDDGALEGYELSFGGDFNADSLRLQIDSLEGNALAGLGAVIILVLILINWRASIVTAIFLPTVMAASFFVLYITGNTLNTLTLFALILVLGLIVDDAIIIVEAIDRQKKNGLKGYGAVRRAIARIGVADILGTITTVLVFAPMLYVSGILGEFIYYIPYTVIITILISLVIGLSLVPFISHFIIPDSIERKSSNKLFKIIDSIFYGISRFITKTGDAWGNVVEWYLGKWYMAAAIIVVTVVLIVGGAMFGGFLKFSIFPPPKDADYLGWQVSFESDTTIEEAETKTKELEHVIVTEGGDFIETVDIFSANRNGFQGFIKLTPQNTRIESAPDIAKNITAGMLNVEATESKVELLSAGPPVSEFPFQMQVFAEDTEILQSATAEIADFLQGREITDASGERITEVEVDYLDVLAKSDSQRYALIKAKVTDPENTQLVLTIQEMVTNEFNEDRLESLGLTEDALGFGVGQESENIESFQSTILVFILSLILMYGLLVVQYNSFSQPLIIFLAIIFSFPGLFPGLYFTDNPFGFFTMIGIIALGGIVVNNTIMLVDYANTEQKNGKTIRAAVAQAIRTRFRPLVTTSITTIIALIPLALSDPFWEGLAFSIIFGLLSSTLFVILAFPAFYGVLEKGRKVRTELAIRAQEKLTF